MWGAIIQAIDHALGRMHEGAGAGIKVANSQHGGGAPISNMDSGTGKASNAAQDIRNQQETTSEQDEAAEKAKIGSNASSTGEVPSEGGQSQGGAGALGSVGADMSSGGDSGGEEAADAASSVLSDANAKTAQGVGSGTNWRSYGAGVGQGMADAGVIAQGKTPAKWEDINKDNAKNAAEKVVKGWKKKDFSKSPDDQQNNQQGQ